MASIVISEFMDAPAVARLQRVHDVDYRPSLVDDPQALRNPRPDSTYRIAGTGPDGFTTGGSRVIQWGWNPVGGAAFFDAALTPNDLVSTVQIGTVEVVTT